MNDTRIEPHLAVPVKILDTLTLRERELLKQNKRLREHLTAVANRIRPGWREQGFGFESSWILEEIDLIERDRVYLEKGMGNLLEVIAHYERKMSNAS
jgi:hypothetical protein